MREKQSLGFRTRSDTNQPVQLEKMARSLKFQIYEERNCTISEAKTKALISCAVTAQLICAFFLAKAVIFFFFFHGVAHI